MTIDDVLTKIKADLAYRTPNLNKPMGHIVLTREEAELLTTLVDDRGAWYQAAKLSLADISTGDLHKLVVEFERRQEN